MAFTSIRSGSAHIYNRWSVSPATMSGSGAAGPSLVPPHQHAQTHTPTAFYPDCREIVQLLNVEQIVGIHGPTPYDIIPLEQMPHNKGHWAARGANNWKTQVGSTSAGLSPKTKPIVQTHRANKKAMKRQLDAGNAASTSRNGTPEPRIVTTVLHAGNGSGTKRKNTSTSPPQPASGRDSPVCGPSLPNKRPLLAVSTSTSTSPAASPQPKVLLLGSEWDKLSVEIFNKYKAIRQSDEMFNRKMRLHEVVYNILKLFFTKEPSFGLYVVGSSMTNFGTNTSDMDMCLMLSHGEIEQRSETMSILRTIQTAMKRTEFVQYAQIIPAKVPILQFGDNVSGVEVDLNVNSAVGIRNTHLLLCYSRLDWRVSPLVLIIKLWAKAHDINDAKRRTISSYSLVLMVVHYLQQVSPPVLPCLHRLYPEKFHSNSDVRRLSLTEELAPFESKNVQSLGELTVGFFFYYSRTFNFVEDAISVRMGERLPKTEVQFHKTPKNDPFQWKCLCIEEPFDLTNTARAVYDKGMFENIKLKFYITWKRLTESKELSCIFPIVQC